VTILPDGWNAGLGRRIASVSNEWSATGVWDALLIDLLLEAGWDADAAMALTAQGRIDAAREAAQDGRLSDASVDALRKVGIVVG
jgi:hypothetical protein